MSGLVLRERDSKLARLQDRLPPVEVDETMRARILERFEATRRETAGIAPAGTRELGAP